MAVTLELVDQTGIEPRATGDTATLSDEGKVTYSGSGVRHVLSVYLAAKSPEEVFRNMTNWSNGYVSLRKKVE